MLAHRVHADAGEGQQWQMSPGNLISSPLKVTVTRTSSTELQLTRKLPPLPPVPETDYLKRVNIRSDRLSKFWNANVNISAWVLLPQGFNDPERRNARYPMVRVCSTPVAGCASLGVLQMIYHGHFTREFAIPAKFSPEPPGPNVTGYERVRALSFATS